MKIDIKKLLPDVCCIALFAVIAFTYFASPVSKGYRLEQHDSGANDGINVEINQYRDSHDGETPRWVTSLFGGMPTYQIAPSYNSTKTMTFVEKVYHLWFPDYVWYIFASMLGFYILLRAFDFRQWMSALGAIVWAFSSYFFIIIAAGHIWKVMALAYIPPTIAGMVVALNPVVKEGKKPYSLGRVLLGGIMVAIFGALQIQANHVQMTYYFLVPELLMVVAFLVMAVQKKVIAGFGKGFAALVVGVVIAVCLNASNLYHTYEYAKDTMRGKSELVKPGAKAEDQTDSGLERSYITAWSYGIDETMTFLIPNLKGGASMPLSMSSTAMKKADGQFEQMGIYNAFTQYWGEQPGTSGPVYLGAFVCMLFILGLIVIPNKNPMKWALIAAGLLTLMLGWGKNFMPLTDFFIDNVPMYAKFRTVASILVVVEFVVPAIALWGLKLWVKKPDQKQLLCAVIFTVVICLVYVVMPGLGGDCVSTNDRNAIAQYVGQGYFDDTFGQNILRSISDMRAAMVSADAWRSILFILLGTAAMYWYMHASKKNEGQLKPVQVTVLSVALLAVCLIDMWQVNKRYLNDDMFREPQGVARIQKTDADNYILETSKAEGLQDRTYRVLNFTVSTFNDNNTSAFYSSIGGYHAAKLRRYQELIETHISSEMPKVYEALRSASVDTMAMAEQASQFPIYKLDAEKTDSLFPVINMLNTRWFILGAGENGEVKLPVENKASFGNAWFATNVEWANNANEEIDALGRVNLRNTAIVAKNDFGFLKAGGEGTVKLTSYGANEARYEVNSAKGGLVVFSEVYYPGWVATIDGQETEVGRANYVLRAINIPAGKHEVVFTFDPQTVRTTESIAYTALGLLVLLIAGLIAVPVICKKKE